MKILPRSLNNLPGNAINRQYRNARLKRNSVYAFMMANSSFEIMNSYAKTFPLNYLSCAATLISINLASLFINQMIDLRKPYKEIYQRALRIKNK